MNAKDLTRTAALLYRTALRLAQERRRKTAAVRAILEAATELGHGEATHALATWNLFGVGMKPNYKRGLELECRAARLGIAEAAFNAAISYETGRGTGRDLSKALAFYRMAARLGDTEALYEVGRMYLYGLGVRADRGRARTWFHKAAKAGVEEAQTQMAPRKGSPR